LTPSSDCGNRYSNQSSDVSPGEASPGELVEHLGRWPLRHVPGLAVELCLKCLMVDFAHSSTCLFDIITKEASDITQMADIFDQLVNGPSP
jgi:hypothetical protein